MPPKKARKAPVPSLQGCTITFSASSIPKDALGGKNLANAKTDISDNGGSYTAKLDDCTHLVVTQAQYDKSAKKIEDAKAVPDIRIVSFEWLEKALSARSPVDEVLYTLYDRSNTGSKSKTATNGATKPTASAKNSTVISASTDSKAAVPKKRKRSADDAVSETDDIPETKRTHGNGKAMNVTTKLDIKIPIDDVLAKERSVSDYSVHIGDDSAIYDVTLNQSDSGKNANKFYRLQLLNDKQGLWYTWTRWGRVGEDGQKKMAADGESYESALAEFHKKFKDKTGNSWDERATGALKKGKYAFIEMSYEDSDSEGEDELPGAEKRKKDKIKQEDDDESMSAKVESKLPPPVQNLLKLIFNNDNFNQTLADLDYDANKMPLGKLSKSSLLRGYEVLKTLASLVQTTGDSDEIETLSNQYLSLIPHIVTRTQRPPVLNHMDKIKKEIELLEALTDMQLANDLMKSAKKSKQTAEEINLLDRQFAGLGLQEMTPVESSSLEFTELQGYLTRSVGHTHGTSYKVQDIFRIERNGETDRFDKSAYASIKNKNRRLLWHGSRATNYGGILSQGLRIAPPEAPVSGYMFGKGVYLADMSSKSANYCCSYSTGGTALLLLCEAELGEPPLKLINADYDAGDKAKKANCFSTWGVGRTAPQAWKDAGTVHQSLKGISMPDVASKAPGGTNEAGAYLQYNEYIVYDVAQIKLRYLLRVQM